MTKLTTAERVQLKTAYSLYLQEGWNEFMDAVFGVLGEKTGDKLLEKTIEISSERDFTRLLNKVVVND